MKVISKVRIVEFIKEYSDSENPLNAWYSIMSKMEFKSLADLRKTFPSADSVDNITVFNIGGNKYRLIAAIHYNRGMVYIRNILTHSEYDKNKWRVKK
ncbi:MAG TPA: type II toxin-antitoxin system HigB family toxin [Spirochaetota bacterium]|nr:type II toxin-antitoxin system HigB family toxin [Spirochaetota bacterium]